MRKLISFMLVSTPVVFHASLAMTQEKKPLIDFPDNQLQTKMKALESRIQAQKDQLEKLNRAASSPSPECQPVQPKCPTVQTPMASAPSKSNSSHELDALRKELAAKDAELKKKTREVVFLKTALAQATASKANAAPAVPVPAAAPTPEPAPQVASQSSAEVFDSRILIQLGYGPNGTQETAVGTAGAVSIVTAYSAVFGVTYERQITPSWSFGVTGLSNKTVLGSVGYGIPW